MKPSDLLVRAVACVRAVVATRRRRVAAAFAAALAVVLCILAAVWLRSQWNRAQEIRAALLEVRAAVSGPKLLDDARAAEDFLQRLGEIELDVLELRASMAPLAWASRALGWLPFIGDDLRAVPRLVDRAALDVGAAGDVVEAGLYLRAEFLKLADMPFSAPPAASPAGGAAAAAAARDRLARALTAVGVARRYAGEVPADGLRPSLKQVAYLLESEEERIAGIAAWGLDAAALMESAQEVAEVSGVLLDRTVSLGGSLEALVGESDRDLARLAAAARRAHELALVVTGTVPPDIASSSLLSETQPMITALHALALTADGAGIGLRSIAEAVRLFEEGDAGPLGDGRRLAAILEVFAGASDNLRQAIALLVQAQEVISEGRRAAPAGSALAAGLDRLHDALDLLVPMLRFVDAGGEIGPSILGVGGTRRYLLLGQSADELRPTGGFVFAVWLVTLVDGELGDIDYFDIIEVDDNAKLSAYPQPPPELERHMNAPVWLMRDASWDPDFPTTAQTAQRLFLLGQEQEVDGVIAFNQWAMQGVLETLGSIDVEFDGAAVDVDNFIPVLEHGTDTHGRAYTDALLKAVLETLSHRLPVEKAFDLAVSLKRVLVAKDMLVYSDDPAEQSVLSRLGWTGAIAPGNGDYVAVFDSNVGWNKADRNVERRLAYEVSFPSEGTPTGRLTLGYRNASDPSPVCDGQWRPSGRGDTYDELKNACYWDYLRVYVPGGASYLGGDRIPLPPGSVHESLGLGAAGDDTFILGAAHGKTVFSGLIALPPPDETQLSFQYGLPGDVLRQDGRAL
ncbi:MAG: DUF4012 domain-containing protein, partial [Gemmatimonadetes bacterium]|nr:DUF4012 domain-containing protein [Gemmatimonadota bacterium]